jgi:hypothetical protein
MMAEAGTVVGEMNLTVRSNLLEEEEELGEWYLS